MKDFASSDLSRLRASVALYYSRKIERYGATALGVDWSCAPTQELRFIQLLKVCEMGNHLSLNDIGCGYGALFSFIRRRYRTLSVDYLGVDLSPAMVFSAKRRRWSNHKPSFVVGHSSPRIADYSVASGIFNVKLNEPNKRWESHIRQTLTDMFDTSRLGFAVNFLGLAHPNSSPIPELYRTREGPWVDFCESRLNMKVEIVQGYGMREFTLLARHTPRSSADQCFAG